MRFVRWDSFDEPKVKRRLLNSFIISAFSGLMVCSLMGFIGLENRDIQSVFSGVAGYAGPAFLDEIVARLRVVFLSKLKKDGIDKTDDSFIKSIAGDENV